MNSRLTNKDLNLIKSAINRAFSRSELRKQVVNACIIQHIDLTRPRVKTWCRCNICKKPTPKSYIECDHLVTRVPLDSSFKEMSLDDYIDRTWCNPSELQGICSSCHIIKTTSEKKIRQLHKKKLAKVKK